ncbi:MAG: septum formation initiator family protein [Candidatus Parcubacteria bacterium]|nr:septum formation initiator family protein [Candidatus Parcubacteria bacterium]
MKNFQQKHNFRSILQSRPVLVFLAILALFFAWGVFGLMNKMSVTIENKRLTANKVAELQKQKEKLSVDIAKLKTESGVEENIRQKFGLVKEGENMIIVVDDQNKPETEGVEKGGFFSFFTNLFK